MSIRKLALAAAAIIGTLGLVGKADAQVIYSSGYYTTPAYTSYYAPAYTPYYAPAYTSYYAPSSTGWYWNGYSYPYTYGYPVYNSYYPGYPAYYGRRGWR